MKNLYLMLNRNDGDKSQNGNKMLNDDDYKNQIKCFVA